jgi:hypothetical protein
MDEYKGPQVRVDEGKIPLDLTVQLSAQDKMQAVMDKGLYRAPGDKPVVIWQDDQIVAVTTVGRLRGRILPRAWAGPLAGYIAGLPLPPEVVGTAPIVTLIFLAHQAPECEWLLVVDPETARPRGILSRRVVLNYVPAADTELEVFRSSGVRLWGDSEVERSYYYCPVEDRIYGPHAVRPGPDGRMRDRRGHVVEKREAASLDRGGTDARSIP